MTHCWQLSPIVRYREASILTIAMVQSLPTERQQPRGRGFIGCIKAYMMVFV